MSRRDRSNSSEHGWSFGPNGPEVGEWRVLVFFVKGDAATDGDHDQERAAFWSVVRQRLESVGLALDMGEADESGETGGQPDQAGPWARFVPRHDSGGLRPVRVKVRVADAPPRPSPGEPTGRAVEPAPLAVVIGRDPEDAALATAVISALHGVGIPCVRTSSLEEAAEAAIDRMMSRLPCGGEHAMSHASGAMPAEHSKRASPWRTALLVPLVGLLVLHSVNPWLRGEVKTRFQLPGFSYDFLNFETVPMVAPLVVGLPTLAAYLVIGRLRRWTQVAPPRWASWALLVPALTTVYFAVRFFREGRIVSTHSQVVHSEGLGMLVETIGMLEPLGDDHFRYRQPGGVNYSHTIQPFWEPWAILLVALAVGVSAVTTLYSRRKNTDP
jgi:hypothetical protein